MVEIETNMIDNAFLESTIIDGTYDKFSADGVTTYFVKDDLQWKFINNTLRSHHGHLEMMDGEYLMWGRPEDKTQTMLIKPKATCSPVFALLSETNMRFLGNDYPIRRTLENGYWVTVTGPDEFFLRLSRDGEKWKNCFTQMPLTGNLYASIVLSMFLTEGVDR